MKKFMFSIKLFGLKKTKPIYVNMSTIKELFMITKIKRRTLLEKQSLKILKVKMMITIIKKIKRRRRKKKGKRLFLINKIKIKLRSKMMNEKFILFMKLIRK